MTFISYSNGLTLIYWILRPFTIHLHVDSWYDVSWLLWWWFLRSAFKHHFNRFSETFTEYCKKYCSLQQNKEQQRSGGWVVFSLSGRKWSRALHYFTWCRHDGDGQASFALQFYICTMKIYTGEKLMHTFIENKRQQKSCSTLYCFNP